MSVTYHLSRMCSYQLRQGQWALFRNDGKRSEELGTFGSKEAGTKVLKALKSGRITEEKARDMGRSFTASMRAHAAKTGHEGKQPRLPESEDERFPLMVRFRPEKEEDAVLLAARLRRRRSQKMKVLRVGGSGLDREARIENVAELVQLIGAIESGVVADAMIQSLDVADHFTGDRIEGADARIERILSLLDAAPEEVRRSYRETACPAEDGGPALA